MMMLQTMFNPMENNPFLLNKECVVFTDEKYVNSQASKIEKITSEIVRNFEVGQADYDTTILMFTKCCISILMDLTITDLTFSQGFKACEARAICYYILRRQCNMSFRAIGKNFKKSPGTVHKSIKQVEFYLEKKLYQKYSVYIETTESLINNFIRISLYGRGK